MSRLVEGIDRAADELARRRDRRKCRTLGHAWGHYTSTSDYRITEICFRGDCDATLTRDMTDAERDDFDMFREAEEGADY